MSCACYIITFFLSDALASWGREVAAATQLRQARSCQAAGRKGRLISVVDSGDLGAWVRREDFRGRKSFGAFQCPRCHRMWTSAHAQTIYKQGCQVCNRASLPLYMWQNLEQRKKGENTRGGKKPHDARRCEACRRGACIQNDDGYV
eukprot:gene13210-19045_t